MFKHTALAGAVAFLSLGSSIVSADYFNARQMALGGTSSIAGDYSGVTSNPALLGNFHSSDDFGTNLSFGIEASDPDDMIDAVDKAQQVIDEVDQKIQDNYDYASNPQEAQDDANRVTDAIENLGGKTVHIKAGMGGQVAIPSEFIGVAIVGGSDLRIASDFTYVSSDEPRIQQNIALGEPMDDLQSYVGVNGVGTTEVGLAFSHSFVDLGVNLLSLPLSKLSVGVTPKYQRIDLVDYEQTIGDFESSDFNEDNFRTEDSGFNADLGFVQYAGLNNQYRIGASVQNLVSREVESPRGGKYELKPVTVVGGGYDNGWLATTFEVDLSERAGFERVPDEQYAKLGFEIDAFRNAQFRLGYRDSINGQSEDVVTAGIGISPFDVIHLDIAGLYGSNSTYGASIELGVKL